MKQQEIEIIVLKGVYDHFYFGIDIKLDTNLVDDLHLDLLDLIEISMYFENEFNITFENEFNENITIRSICSLIEELI